MLPAQQLASFRGPRFGFDTERAEGGLFRALVLLEPLRDDRRKS